MRDEAVTELAPETVLKRGYRIVRKLGEGNMGRVYEAVQIELERTCALKQTFYYEEAERNWFKNEAQTLSVLSHPALPHVYDYFEESGSYFFVMDLIHGPSLKTKLEETGAISPSSVLKWASQVLEALHYLHTRPRPIIHRDIKPDNIRIDGDKVFLVDFGLAKDMTTGTVVHGHTPDYAPPEQAQPGRGTDRQSDIYSFGATLYHLLTGALPARASDRDLALQKNQSDPLRPAHELNAQVSEALAAVISKAMAFQPEQRFESAKVMLDAMSDTARAVEYAGSGFDWLKKKNYDRAISDFSNAIKRQGDYAIAYVGRGQAYVGKREYTHAMDDLNKAIHLNQGIASAYFNRAWVYAEKEESALSIADYTKAIALEPTDSAAYNNRGLRYVEQKNFGLAIEDYRRASELAPKRPLYIRNRGSAYKALGDFAKAKADFAKALELAPKNSSEYKWASMELKLLRRGNQQHMLADLLLGIVAALALVGVIYHMGKLLINEDTSWSSWIDLVWALGFCISALFLCRLRMIKTR